MGTTTIGIIGSGQMGGGIALVAAVAKHNVVVFDKANEALTKCKADHAKRLAREVEKGRMNQGDVDAALGRLKYVHHVDGLKDAEVVIEAIVEDAKVKCELFAQLAKIFPGNQILATNTSSISITEIAAAADHAHRRIFAVCELAEACDQRRRLVAHLGGLSTSPVGTFGGALSHRMLSTIAAESRMPSLVSFTVKRTTIFSPGSTSNFAVSQPVPPP